MVEEMLNFNSEEDEEEEKEEDDENNDNNDDLLISKQNDSDGAMIELMHEHADIELKSKTSPHLVVKKNADIELKSKTSPHLVVREAIVVNDSDLETSTTPNNNCDVEQLDDAKFIN
eukprot:CAMPEP_0168596526 /NCGR_PEP_ID=MMETSP0420-20121227/10066_1 /TAXON_ID=498008 /ORGANISM="Pessonella sp." /LENGTH=116 /DNA_ID=CAMNT_0008633093 /DNA_START=694 /DNA_END=1042 /DNA_ORIENTATION=-